MTDEQLTAILEKYADDTVKFFDVLELPASISVFIESDKDTIQTCSLRRGDINSLVINTVIRDINYLVNNVEFLQALQHALETK